MITLLSSLFGFVTSFAPELFNFVKDKGDKAHELEIMKLQLQAGKDQAKQSVDEIEIGAALKETEILYKDNSESRSAAAMLAASVRPIITYSFFFLYIGAKVMMFYANNFDYDLWNDEDQALFGAVVGFWFGHRAFNKIKNKY